MTFQYSEPPLYAYLRVLLDTKCYSDLAKVTKDIYKSDSVAHFYLLNALIKVNI
jgi:hypothetical protein